MVWTTSTSPGRARRAGASDKQARSLIPAFGAEIIGVDPGTWLDDDTIAFLRAAFDDRGLLLFRGVDVDRPHQFYLSELLRGLEPPTPEEAAAGAAEQDKFVISNKEPDAAAPIGRLMFHCDSMWSDEPFEVLSLYGVEVEPPVIPTLFASSDVRVGHAPRRVACPGRRTPRRSTSPARSTSTNGVDAPSTASCRKPNATTYR